MPTFGVTIAIIQDRQILLTKRSDFPVWCLPGGAVDDAESLAQAAVRESREETGLVVEITRLVGVYSRPRWRRGGDHSTLFAARPIGGSLQTVTDETVDAGYFHPDALPDTLFWWHRQRIHDAFGNAVGVVRLQDVVWPFGQVTENTDVRTLVEQSGLPIADLFEQLCGHRGWEPENPQAPDGQRPAIT
jgi:ADP-ribose pyrophosphatase YjhB (NUDIX family)